MLRLKVRLRMQVRPLGTGRFWCLYCETDKGYQHWEWRSVGRLRRATVMEVSSGEFVLCDVCESALDLECLDESSTASYEELVVHPPLRALLAIERAERRKRPAGPPWERTIADALSANSKFRRH